jgi:hypothetical protein
MADVGAEVLSFEDAVCIALDMVHPRRPHAISLADLRRCGHALGVRDRLGEPTRPHS